MNCAYSVSKTSIVLVTISHVTATILIVVTIYIVFITIKILTMTFLVCWRYIDKRFVAATKSFSP